MSQVKILNKCIGGPKDGEYVSISLGTGIAVPNLQGTHYYAWNNRKRTWEYEGFKPHRCFCSDCEGGV